MSCFQAFAFHNCNLRRYPAAYARFLKDFGWLIEAHWRYQLYSPAARRTARRIVASFAKRVAPNAVPKMTSLMVSILQVGLRILV
jgi:hypothetical protein